MTPAEGESPSATINCFHMGLHLREKSVESLEVGVKQRIKKTLIIRGGPTTGIPLFFGVSHCWITLRGRGSRVHAPKQAVNLTIRKGRKEDPTFSKSRRRKAKLSFRRVFHGFLVGGQLAWAFIILEKLVF